MGIVPQKKSQQFKTRIVIYFLSFCRSEIQEYSVEPFWIRISMRLQLGGSHPKGLFTHLSGNCAEKGGGWSIGSRGGPSDISLYLHLLSPHSLSCWWLHGLLTQWLKAQSVQDFKEGTKHEPMSSFICQPGIFCSMAFKPSLLEVVTKTCSRSR